MSKVLGLSIIFVLLLSLSPLTKDVEAAKKFSDVPANFLYNTTKLDASVPESELVVTTNYRNNVILVNGITLGSSKQEVINKLGNPKVRDNKQEDYFLYSLKSSYDNSELELYVEFYNNKVESIIFDINKNVINTNWYKDLGQPFTESEGVTYFYLEGTEQILMFIPNENNAYVGYADNNFYYHFGMKDKMW